MRSLSRRRTAISSDKSAVAGSKAEMSMESPGSEIASEAPHLVAPSDVVTPGQESKPSTTEMGKTCSPNTVMCKSEGDAQQQQPLENKCVEQPKPCRLEAQGKMGSNASVRSNMHDYMPQNTTGKLLDKTSPTRRAESRKQQVLAKVAQDHETSREQLFVFSKAASSPNRNRTGKDGVNITTHRTEARKASLPDVAIASSKRDAQEQEPPENKPMDQQMPCRPEGHVLAESDSSVIWKSPEEFLEGLLATSSTSKC
jgi:hypothetical protein